MIFRGINTNVFQECLIIELYDPQEERKLKKGEEYFDIEKDDYGMRVIQKTKGHTKDFVLLETNSRYTVLYSEGDKPSYGNKTDDDPQIALTNFLNEIN